MKHITALLALAILCISTAAIAYDMTYLGIVKAHGTIQVPVELPAGTFKVEVWANDNATITCAFVDKGTGEVAYQAKDVRRCVGYGKLSVPGHILASITNDNDKGLDFKVWVHDAK